MTEYNDPENLVAETGWRKLYLHEGDLFMDMTVWSSGSDALSFTRHVEGSAVARAYLTGNDLKVLEKYLQQKRDEELGRWRWPENPDYLVYPLGDGRVDVLRESSVAGFSGPGRHQGISSGDADAWDNDAARNFYSAARAYFAAHPETKPWHDAKPGEVWDVVVEDSQGGSAVLRAMVMLDQGEPVFVTGDKYDFADRKIVEATRVLEARSDAAETE